MSVIAVDNLTKDYGQGRGVFSVSFQVEQGEALGFLGPNGAGKTTTIRHLMGFSNPQSGQCLIGGMRCDKHAAAIMRSVGYLPGEVALPENLTGMAFIRMMQGLRNSHNEERLKYLLDLFQLDAQGKTKHMSLGSKRKLAAVCAFMDDPAILILDEPTSGLDPVMQDVFASFVREEKQRGKTVLLSSHMFSEVETLCDQVAIIKDGRLVSTVVTDDIRRPRDKSYVVTFGDARSMQVFVTGSDFELLEVDERRRTATVKTTDQEVNRLVEALSLCNVICLREEKRTLERFFLHFYEKSA